ncbi:MAG: DUF927 domain-containing protein [Lachnospiraceae bacterium]|nr:DUF927 domain-containing protein [Lachnospiraceae bacterium]MCM1234423.1 DUF927 domain-containing protein [Ruminococcus flavefaciens]
MIDKIIPVNFSLEMNGEKNISVSEYAELMAVAKTYKIGNGKNACSYNLVHTTAGYVDIETKKNGAVAVWIADSFQIKGVFSDEKNNHYAEIETKNKTFKMPFESLLPQKIDIALFNKGIAVSAENNANKLLSMHLQWLLSRFEIQDIKQILGWKQNEDKLQWNGANTEPSLLQYKLSENSEKDYIGKLNGFINNVPELQFVVCTATVSTLLAYLNITEKIPVASFGVSLIGKSSTGKSTALVLAASLYSSPDDESVFSGFYGTQNALTYMLGKHNGVPLCYDESTIDNNINKGNFVYTFVEGKDKLRLNQDSTLKKRNSWLCTALFSAETPFVDISENDNLGLGVRMLNLENYVYTKNSTHSDEIKTFSRLNYGIVGNLISDYLLKADSKEVRKKYEEIKQEISAETKLNKCSLTDRLLLNYALILQMSAILNELGILIDTEKIWRICIDNHNKIAESSEQGKNIVIKLFNCISSNYKNLKGIKWTTNKEGIPSKSAIIETTFEDIMKKCEVKDYKSAVKHLDNEGYLIRQSKGRVKSKLSIDGIPCYAYQFDMKKINETFGKINDDTFSNIKKYKQFSPFNNESIEVVNDEEAIIHAGNYKVECNKIAVCGEAFLL